jgi:hypothetical protein
MALKCPVLPPYHPENQAQALPTRLAQVGLVLPSGFSTKISKAGQKFEKESQFSEQEDEQEQEEVEEEEDDEKEVIAKVFMSNQCSPHP